MQEQDCEQLTFFPADFLVNHSPLPGSAEASRMTAISGRRCSELYASCGPLGSLEKMLLESSIWSSTRCYLTWKAKVTPAGRWYFWLWPSTPRTGETGAQSWPAPTAADSYTERMRSTQQKLGSRHSVNLVDAVKLFPTPIATDYKNRECKDSRKNRKRQLQTEIGGALNPDWVEWLMGFPAGWTEV